MLHPLACKLLCVLCCPLHCLAGWHVCTALSALFYALAIASYVSIGFPLHNLVQKVFCACLWELGCWMQVQLGQALLAKGMLDILLCVLLLSLNAL